MAWGGVTLDGSERGQSGETGRTGICENPTQRGEVKRGQQGRMRPSGVRVGHTRSDGHNNNNNNRCENMAAGSGWDIRRQSDISKDRTGCLGVWRHSARHQTGKQR